MSKFLKRVIVVDGEDICVDVDAELPIVDVDEDMRRVAAQMGYWGAVMGAAEREKEAVDAFYRRWRAQTQNAILESDPKLSEYKVKSRIEAEAKFLELKDAYARCCEAHTTSRNTFEALGRRANLLQSMGAKLRTELEAGRKTTTKARPASAAPAPPPVTSVDDDGDDPGDARGKMTKLKESLKGGKKSAKKEG